MVEALKLRLDILNLPQNKSYMFKNSKLCRFGCFLEEDIFHILNCKEDKILNKPKIDHILKFKTNGLLRKKLIKNSIKLMKQREKLIKNANNE